MFLAACWGGEWGEGGREGEWVGGGGRGEFVRAGLVIHRLFQMCERRGEGRTYGRIPGGAGLDHEVDGVAVLDGVFLK